MRTSISLSTRTKGDLEIWRNRTIVADGEVEEPNEEIELSEALKIEPDFEIGEEVSESVSLVQLGRRFVLSFARICSPRSRSTTTVFSISVTGS